MSSNGRQIRDLLSTPTMASAAKWLTTAYGVAFLPFLPGKVRWAFRNVYVFSGIQRCNRTLSIDSEWYRRNLSIDIQMQDEAKHHCTLLVFVLG